MSNPRRTSDDGVAIEVSVVVATQNRPTMLRAALASVEAQTFKSYEIIVVQNGPSQESCLVVEDCLQRGLPVKYHFMSRAHPVRARNAGIRLARGRYVAFLEDDDEWMPRKLEAQLAAFDRSASIGLVTCRSIMVDEVNQRTSLRPLSCRECDFHALVSEESVNLVSSLSGILVKRQCFETVGYFDPRYWVSSDVDFYMRLAQNYEIATIDEPLFFYRWHGRNLSANGVQGRLDMIAILRKTRPSSSHGVDALLIKNAIAHYRLNLCQVSEYVMTRQQWRQAFKGFAFAVYYEPFIGRRLNDSTLRPLAKRLVMPYRHLVACLWHGGAGRLRRLRDRAVSMGAS